MCVRKLSMNVRGIRQELEKTRFNFLSILHIKYICTHVYSVDGSRKRIKVKKKWISLLISIIPILFCSDDGTNF